MIAVYLAALSTDDERARFIKIYEDHNRRVFLTARSIVKTHERGEDVAQDVWTKVVQHFDKVDAVPEERLGAYLTTMARNFSINLLKKESRTVEMPDGWADGDWVESAAIRRDNGAVNGDGHVMAGNLGAESELTYNYLVKLILNMPENYRQILELKYVFEWKNKEIAAFMGMKQSSIESRIARGREMLKEKIRREGLHI